MTIRSSAPYLALIAGLGLTLAGCGKLNDVRAMKAFKDGNKLYQGQDWRQAAEKYEETIALDPDNNLNSCGDTPGCVYFYLANSYDQMYRPTRKGEPQNDQYLQKAIENYTLAAEKITNNPKMRGLSLSFLIAAYGPEKLNDPTKAEPVVRKMIETDPNEAVNYFQLSRIYEDSGEYELAEQVLMKGREVRPNDPQVHLYLAGYYARQGDFDKTVAAHNDRIRIEPNNPEGHYSLGYLYWESAFRDFRLNDKQKLEYVMKGLEAMNRAIELNKDYLEAIVYKNVLLRLQANLEKDPKKQQELLREADQLRNRVTELQKKRAAGVSD